MVNCLFMYYSSLQVFTSSPDGPWKLIGNMIGDVLVKYLECCNLSQAEYATLTSLLSGPNNSEKAPLQQTIMAIFKDCFVDGLGPCAIKAFLSLYVMLYDVYHDWPQKICDDIDGATCDMLEQLMSIDDFSFFAIWSAAAYKVGFEDYFRQKHGHSLFSTLSAQDQQTFSDYKNR